MIESHREDSTMTSIWNLKTVDEILLELEQADYQDFLIDGLISSSVTTILGDPYIGKTHMGIDVSRSLTTGEPFLGREVNKQVDRIAFLCTDPGGHIKTAQRIKKAGLDGRRVLAQPFYTPESWEEWREAVDMFKRMRIGAIVVDNTTDLAEDANGPAAVKIITDGLRYWSDNGATILNLHHRNKQGGYFGSIQWQKWTRVELEISGQPRTNVRRLKSLANDAEPVDWRLRFDYRSSPAFTYIGEHGGNRQIELSDQSQDLNERVKAWMQDHPGTSYRVGAQQMTKDFDAKVSLSRVKKVMAA
jgi:hypothetical protein